MEHNIHRESNQSVCLTVMMLFRYQFGSTKYLQAIQIVTILNIWGASHLWEQFIFVRLNVELFLVAHWFVTTQANNDKCTCFTMAGCHTVLTPIEKQSGQQLLSACHLTCLNGLNISCYPINTPHHQQQFDSSWNKHMKKWGYFLVVADMSYSGKLCLAII